MLHAPVSIYILLRLTLTQLANWFDWTVSDSFRMANNPELLLGRFRISSAFPWAGKLWSPSRTSHWDTRESLEEALQTSQSPVPGSVLKTDKYILDEVNGEFDKCPYDLYLRHPFLTQTFR